MYLSINKISSPKWLKHANSLGMAHHCASLYTVGVIPLTNRCYQFTLISLSQSKCTYNTLPRFFSFFSFISLERTHYYVVPSNVAKCNTSDTFNILSESTFFLTLASAGFMIYEYKPFSSSASTNRCSNDIYCLTGAARLVLQLRFASHITYMELVMGQRDVT